MAKKQDILDKWDLFNLVSIGVCIINQDRKVTFWNDAIEQWTGVSRENILNRNISDFFEAFKHPYIEEQMDLIFAGWPPVVFSSLFSDPVFYNVSDHNIDMTFFVKVSGHVELDGNSYAVISIENNTDISHQLNEQRRLIEKAKAEINLRKEVMNKLMESEASMREIDKMKNQLFSIIGHDLRSPIASLVQYALVMQSDKIKENKITRESFDLVHDLSKTALDLLQNLLDWAKIQMHGFVFTPSEIVLNEAMHEVIKQVQVNARQKNIRIENNIPAEQVLFADRNMLITLLRNLIGNSIKYCNHDGRIRIEGSGEGKYSKIIIHDDGIGMSEKDLKKLNMNQQVESKEGTGKEKGIGIGLVLCKNIIDKHNGTFSVESELGVGSSFTIEFPKKFFAY